MLFVAAVVVIIVHMYRLPVCHQLFYLHFKSKNECSVKAINKQFHLGFREQ